jgi:hypothetical protein
MYEPACVHVCVYTHTLEVLIFPERVLYSIFLAKWVKITVHEYMST